MILPSSLCLWCRLFQGLAKKGVEEFVSSKRWQPGLAVRAGVAEKKSVPEEQRMRLPWEPGAAAEQQQLSFHMPLLFCFPPTLHGSVAVLPAFPAPRWAVAERTNAVCDLIPSENKPWPALSPCITAHKGEEQSHSSHPKGWISSSCWTTVCAVLWGAALLLDA